jgi:hypothetical protein
MLICTTVQNKNSVSSLRKSTLKTSKWRIGRAPQVTDLNTKGSVRSVSHSSRISQGKFPRSHLSATSYWDVISQSPLSNCFHDTRSPQNTFLNLKVSQTLDRDPKLSNDDFLMCRVAEVKHKN